MQGFLPRHLAPGFWLGAFFFCLAVGYLPGAFNATTAGRWALLSVGVPVGIFLLHRTINCPLGLAFLAWAALSLLWTPLLVDGARVMWQLLLMAGAFAIGARLPSLRPVYVGLGLGMALNAALVLAQYFGGFDAIYQVAGPAGLFVNKNYLAEAAALALVGLTGHRLWWLAAAVLPCVILTGARGALLGLGAAFATWLWGRSRVGTVALGLVAFLACLTLIGTSSVDDRLMIWRDTVNGLTWLGRGIGSFFHDYPSHAGLKDLLNTRPANAHNDFLEILYELGPVGLGLFLALIWSVFRSPRPIERAVLAAFMTEAFFAFPLHLPVTAAVAALAAGHLSGARAYVCDGLAAERVAHRHGTMALCR